MTEFTKNIIGGLNLDDQLDTMHEDHTTDALNVTHAADSRKQGDMRPSVGVAHEGFVFRNQSSKTRDEMFHMWSTWETSHTVSLGKQSLIVKFSQKEQATAFFSVKAEDDWAFRGYENGTYIDTIANEVCGLYYDKDYVLDDTWSTSWHTHAQHYNVFFCKERKRMMIFSFGPWLVPTFFPFGAAPNLDHYPAIQVVGFAVTESLARPSMTRYVYRVQFIDGTYDGFTGSTPLVPIPSSFPKDVSVPDSLFAWPDDDHTSVKSNMKIKLEIDFRELPIINARRVEVFAIRYTSGSGIPFIECIGVMPYQLKVTMYDGDQHKPSLVTAAEVLLRDQTMSCGASAVKDDTLYVGNITDCKNADLDGFDLRAWQFNADKNAMDQEGKLYTFDALTGTEPKGLPELWRQNMANDGKDFGTYAGHPEYCVFGKDGSTHGASGKNVELQFVVGEMDYGNVYPEAYDGGDAQEDKGGSTLDTPGYEFSKVFRNISPATDNLGMNTYNITSCGWIAENTVNGLPAHTDMSIYAKVGSSTRLSQIKFALEPEHGGHSYANPMFGSKFACLQHDSVYRFGLVAVFYDYTISDVYHIGDFRTPSMDIPDFKLWDDHREVNNSVKTQYEYKDGTKYNVAQYVEMKFYPLFVRVKVSNIPKKVKFFKLVYAIRGEEDRNVVTTGVVHRTHGGINPANMAQSMFKSSSRHTLPPLPTLGVSRYYFGGVNGFIETDWGIQYHRDYKANSMKTRQVIINDIICHSYPNQPTFACSKNFGVDLWRVYLSAPVIINSEEIPDRKRGYLFYCPEADLVDLDGRPILHLIQNTHVTAKTLCLHSGLSSLMPASLRRDMLACLYSDNNAVFTGKFANKVNLRNPEDVNYDGIYQTFRTNMTEEYIPLKNKSATSGATLWPFHPCIMTTNITTFLSALKQEWQGQEDAYGPPREKDHSWQGKVHGFMSGCWAGIKHFFGGSKGKTYSEAYNDAYEDSAEYWDLVHDEEKAYRDEYPVWSVYSETSPAMGRSYWRMMWTKEGRDMIKHGYMPAIDNGLGWSACEWLFGHKDNQDEIDRIQGSSFGRYRTAGVDFIQGSMPNKVAKYIIPWTRYKNGDITRDIPGGRMIIEDKKYVNDAYIKVCADCFRFLWPCSTKAMNYVPEFSTNMIDHYDIKGFGFVNIAPLWSGDWHPHGTSEKSRAFLPNAYMTQCSSMHRNIAHNIMWDQDKNGRPPCYPNILDASRTPLSDHGQRLHVGASQMADLELFTTICAPWLSCDAPEEYDPSLSKFKMFSFSDVNTEGVDQFENDGWALKYPAGHTPGPSDLLLPDVMWDEWKARSTDISLEFNCMGKNKQSPKNLLETDKGTHITGKKLTDVLKSYQTNDWDKAKDSGNIGFNYSLGLNSHGYGANAIIFTTKDDSDFPGSAANFSFLDSADGNDHLYLNGRVRQVRDEFNLNNPDYVTEALNKGSHVIFASLRNSINPYQNQLLETTMWSDVSPECTIVNSDEWQTVYGFDTFVGANRRMYLNAYYPDNVMVRGEGTHPSSVPISMIFPYEGMINIDISNTTDTLYDPMNPGGGSQLKRISKQPGTIWPLPGGGDYVGAIPENSYNICYSRNDPVPEYVSGEQDLNLNLDMPNKLAYNQYNFDWGRFNVFKPGNDMLLDNVCGKIQLIAPFENDILIAQERGIAVVTPNARTLFQTQEANAKNLYIGSGTLLGDKHRYLTNLYGASDQARVLFTPNAVYWADIVHDAIIKASRQGVENIAETGKVQSFIRSLRKNYGTTITVSGYRLQDGNLRFVFGDGLGRVYENSVIAYTRESLEYSEELSVFTSFNSMAEFDNVNINGLNLYAARGFLFTEGTYNSWHFFEDLDIPPHIEVYINPTKDLHDKHFVACVLPQFDDATIDTVLEMKFPINDREGFLYRTLQFAHYVKKEDNAVRRYDGQNVVNQFTSGLDTPHISMPRLLYDEAGPDTKKVISLLGRGIQYGKHLSMALDKIQGFEIDQEQGTALTGKGFTLRVRFQTFNSNCVDEIGRKPTSNVENKSWHLGRRRGFSFVPLHIQYTPSPKS